MSAVGRVEKNSPDLALALASGASAADAAQRAGVSTRTVRRRLADPVFRNLVASLRQQLFTAALGCMADNMTRAANALAGLLDDGEPALRLRAARAVLSLGLRLRDSVEVGDRLHDLEQELQRREGGRP